jgi:hypothetical protein
MRCVNRRHLVKLKQDDKYWGSLKLMGENLKDVWALTESDKHSNIKLR